MAREPGTRPEPGVTVHPLPAKYFVDAMGGYLGAFAGVERVYDADGEINDEQVAVKVGDVVSVEQPMPDDPAAVEVPRAPKDGRQKWNFTTSRWGTAPPPPSVAERIDRELDDSVSQLGLVRLLAKRFNMTESQIRVAIKAEVA